MSSRTNNFNNDLAMPYWNNTTKQRVFREIATETEKGNTGLALKRDLQAEATNLSALLKDLEDTTIESIGAIEYDMQVTYAAEFGLVYDPTTGTYYDTDAGVYYETVFAKIRADAESISEAFNNSMSIAMAEVDDLETTITELSNIVNGEIRRGFIDVTEGGTTKTYFGIAITSRNIFTANVRSISANGETHEYHEISDSAPCFGLYTATGWQFWRGNERMGWYDTEDGQLHVDHINVESDFQMGNWKFVNNGTSFGIKYIGA